MGLAPLLKAHGFRKKRHHFVRIGESAVNHISVQASQWNSPGKASFTINLWSNVPAIAAALGESPVVDHFTHKVAHCGLRIGHLLPTPGDFWWEIRGEEDIARIAKEISDVVECYALPYLERTSTIEGIAELSGHIPGIANDPTEPKAVALRLLGREQEAKVVESGMPWYTPKLN